MDFATFTYKSFSISADSLPLGNENIITPIVEPGSEYGITRSPFFYKKMYFSSIPFESGIKMKFLKYAGSVSVQYKADRR